MSDDRRRLASELIVFSDGLEEGGLLVYARRSRVVARELLCACDELEAERSARVALQLRCETLQEIVGGAAYQACVKAEANVVR
jgi:hypothetical protein